MCRLRKPVAAAWERNLQIYQNDPDEYFRQISEFLSLKMPQRFRFHIGGDIPNMDYFERMMDLATKYRYATEFLCFSKKYEILIDGSDAIPENMAIYASIWPGLDFPELPQGIGKAWIADDPRRPIGNYYMCGGTRPGCAACGHTCWNMQGGDVVFPKH